MPAVLPRLRLLLLIALILSGLIVSWRLGGQYAEQRTWLERSDEANSQLQLYAQSIHTLIDRFSSVPALLAQDHDIRRLLLNPDSTELRQALNVRLERLNQAAGSTVLYLLDNQGETLAASNWQMWSSFVGHRYAFRPYFRKAMTDGEASYFAVGVTTGVPGYFLSHIVRDENDKALGVLVVKLELEDLQRSWADQPGVLLVTDDYSVVILSNRPAWRYRSLETLRETDREEVVTVRRYAEQALQPLPREVIHSINEQADWVRVEGPDGKRNYLWQHLHMPRENWTLHLFSEPANLAENVRSYRLAAAGIWMTLVFFLLFLYQRYKMQRLQAGIRQRLERKVSQRTAELRQAQDGLVHAAKMAALGQMSAALAHELNQPLTALQMQLGSLRLLLDSGRPEAIGEGLQRVDALLQRMGALTKHLKTFARKTPRGLNERLRPADVIEQALLLLAARIRQEQVSVHTRLDRTIDVMGDAIRLEQVIINLLHNALDAMSNSEKRELDIVLAVRDGLCRLSIGDSGGGIDEAKLDTVFEPFFTTKPIGEGLGLGLAISSGIVQEMGGTLTVANSEKGAVFTVNLPLAQQ